MTFFIKLENGQPVSNAIAEENFRQLFPNVSFPAHFTADAVEPLGYGIYDFSNQPEAVRYQKVIESAPVRNEFGIWRQAWQLVEMNDEEKANADRAQGGAVRGQRNSRLAQSDWTQLADAPVDKAAWATYRQALRDVTAQAEFPWNIDWPIQPE